MAKAAKAVPKPKRKLTKKEQAERFRATARELACDESPDALDKAFDRLEPRRPPNA
jgi:hypothetical protein